MRNLLRLLATVGAVVLLFIAAPRPAASQWIKYTNPGTPRTSDDPKAYTRPWSFTMKFQIMPDTELIEDVCENEKDAGHLITK